MRLGVGGVSKIILFWPEEVESYTEGLDDHAEEIADKEGERGLKHTR